MIERLFIAAISIALACQVGCRLTGSSDGTEYKKGSKICACFFLVPLKDLNRSPFLLNLNPNAKNKEKYDYER